ncbi:MAG: PTS sugar transporter subunit IIA [Desulfobacterales bacterium]|nr:PTS sugar transporter subunit IIA [Desulfobacterales bacterium]
MTQILTKETIKLRGKVKDKEDAIKQAGDLLVLSGCVHQDYVKGMLEREKTMSTFVGNGVSIPHGQFDDLSLIYRSGISVLQVPNGVEWEPDNIAYLIVGIAATSGEHIGILANLAEVVEDVDTSELMAKTEDPDIIMSFLNREPRKNSSD